MSGINSERPLERAAMASWNSPAVARRWLAYELRRLREEQGLAQRDVGKACGWSGVKVSYLENAQQNVADEDLDKLLPLYGVPEGERADFHRAADASRQKGWWERYDDTTVPPFLAEYIGLEQGASLIKTFEPTIVPGLLQVRAYMESVIRADLTPRTERLVAQIVDVRLARQGVLSRGDEPVALLALLDESVVRRVVGGPEVMAVQLRHIAEMCERPNVVVRVFPFERGVSPGFIPAAHRILHFGGGVAPTVYLEAREDAQWVEDESTVDSYDLMFGKAIEAALTPEESREMFLDAADSYAARA